MEQNEKGLSVNSFRDQASDIIMRTYLMLQTNFGPDGQTSMYKLLLSPLVASDPYQAEVAIFGARSILEILVDETIDDTNRPFIAEIFAFITQQEIARSSFVLAKGACGFVHDAAKQLGSFADQISPMFAYLLDI